MMHQEDINKDLGHYIHDRKKDDSMWKKMFKSKKVENLKPEDKKELEQLESKIEEVNKVEEEIEETIEQEKEGLLTRFFKKLKTRPQDQEPIESENVQEESSADPEMKEFLKRIHHWITRLDPDVQQEFKRSSDFELYTKMLKKHDLIKTKEGENNGQ